MTFMRVYLFTVSIKITTGFPVGNIGHNPFFPRLTLRAPVSTPKKCVEIEFDNVEK